MLSSKYDIPYRKDRTNHGGGLLMYLSCELAHARIIGLKLLILVFHLILVIHIFNPLNLNLLFVILNEVSRIFI